MTRIVPHRFVAARPSNKLDPRLAALLDLPDTVFEPGDTGALLPGTVTPREESTTAGATTISQRRSGPLAFVSGPRSLSGTFDRATSAEAATLTRVAVFVTAHHAKSLDAVARKAGGIRWRSRAGNMATADVTALQLRELDEDDDVAAVEWTGGARPLSSPGGIRGVSPRAAVGLRSGARAPDGTGAVIGVVDIEGLDLYHPDFATDAGVPRILSIWDQSVDPRKGRPGAAPVPFGYGIEYTFEDLWMELDPNSRRRHRQVAHTPLKVSHGTLVAGVAAGGGIEDPTARGVAPGASLVYVGTRASSAGALAAMTEIAEAVDYVFRTAGDRPCVVNVSLGDDLGPRNGESPLERFFDELLRERPGRAIVVAAGNSHAADTHVAGELPASGETVTLVCEAPRPSSRNVVIEIWTPAIREEESGVSLQITSADASLATPPIPPDGLARAYDLGPTRVVVTSVKRYPKSPDALLRVEMFPAATGGAIADGNYELRLTGDGTARPFHAWLAHSFFKLRSVGESGPPGEPGSGPVTVASPGTSKLAVSVGACDHEHGRPTAFTGSGPDRSGARKPDVLACGVSLRAPSAATPDRSYSAFTGTSAAAPLVAGSIALMFDHALRRGHTLSIEQTRALVRAAAGEPLGSAPHAHGPTGRFLLPPDGDLDPLFAAAGVPLGETDTDEISRSRAPESVHVDKKEGVTMSTNESQTTKDEREPTDGDDSQQISIGYYNLHQGPIQVGRLLVVQDGEATVEHWDLWRSYRAPSKRNFRQDITFVYRGEAVAKDAFLAEMPPDNQHIVALCSRPPREG